MHEPLAREAAKDRASSLSKLALSAGSMARELWEGRIRLADGGGMNLYWFTSQPI